MNEANEPAFPFDWHDWSAGVLSLRQTFFGLTKREYFAAMAMQGAIASTGPNGSLGTAGIAEYAVCCADALLAELAKPKDGGK